MNAQTSSVHPNASIGKNVHISDYVTIEEDVVIEEGTYIYPNAYILSGTHIGKNCKIHSGAVVGGDPQDLKYNGEKTTLRVGDGTVIREFVTLNRGTKSTGTTIIGKNCLLMAYVHIAHDCVIGDHVIVSNSCQIAGEVHIEDYVIVGGMSAIHQFCRIGQHAMLAGGSLTVKDVPPYVRTSHGISTYAGINSLGLRRRQISEEIIEEIQNIFRYIFKKNMNYSQACDAIEKEFAPTIERDNVLNFIRLSKRGIIKS